MSCITERQGCILRNASLGSGLLCDHSAYMHRRSLLDTQAIEHSLLLPDTTVRYCAEDVGICNSMVFVYVSIAKSSTVVHACTPSSWEAEAGEV